MRVRVTGARIPCSDALQIVAGHFNETKSDRQRPGSLLRGNASLEKVLKAKRFTWTRLQGLANLWFITWHDVPLVRSRERVGNTLGELSTAFFPTSNEATADLLIQKHQHLPNELPVPDADPISDPFREHMEAMEKVESFFDNLWKTSRAKTAAVKLQSWWRGESERKSQRLSQQTRTRERRVEYTL